MSILLVGVGGIIGALLRFQISRWISAKWLVTFPLATMLINISGAFLLAWLTRWFGILMPIFHTSGMLLLGTGLCGAYTTMSTFSYESIMLLRERRYVAAGYYILGTSLLGLLATGFGLYGLH